MLHGGSLRHQTRNQSADRGEDFSETHLSFMPHPYAELGFSAMPAGYTPVAFYGRGGLQMESHYILADASAPYDNGRKDNFNDLPNPKGHDRYLRSSVYFRPAGKRGLHNWFFGGGWRWSQYSSTEYSKGGSRPMFGGGFDFDIDPSKHPDCMICEVFGRVELNWIMAGTDWKNGVHGPEFGLVMPHPSQKGHFLRYRFALDL